MNNKCIAIIADTQPLERYLAEWQNYSSAAVAFGEQRQRQIDYKPAKWEKNLENFLRPGNMHDYHGLRETIHKITSTTMQLSFGVLGIETLFLLVLSQPNENRDPETMKDLMKVLPFVVFGTLGLSTSLIWLNQKVREWSGYEGLVHFWESD